MRRVDVDRLSQPYQRSVPTPTTASFLGVDVPEWTRVEGAILEDLSSAPPYGISWWATGMDRLGTSRRILISDYLYSCAHSVADNLAEAGLHWLDFLDNDEQESDFIANCVQVKNGRPIVKMPPRMCPLDDVRIHVIRAHIVGTLRALAGALDCVAGTIVGVLALPTTIQRASFAGLRKELGQCALPTGVGEKMQCDFAAKLEEAIERAGPTGWLEWTLAFRNMVIHRGRRIEIGQIVPRVPRLYGPTGEPVPRMRRVTHLPRDPMRSDVEVLLQTQGHPSVLAETVEDTIPGILRSTTNLIDAVGALLLSIWIQRRANPTVLLQPRAQWPYGVAGQPTIQFSGYRPNSSGFAPDVLVSDGIVQQRMRAAALMDDQRAQWNDFD